MDSIKIMNMDFGSALKECTKNNRLVGRKINLKYIITAQVPSIIDENIIPKMTSLNDAAKDIILATCKRIHYHHQLLRINLNTGEAEQYMPNAEDLFAKDWQVIDETLLEEIKFRFGKQSLI